MDCNKIDRLLMKYFDNNLQISEKEELDAHLKKCPSCKEDFSIYTSILEKFNKSEIINAPEGFVEDVMKKIDCLEISHGKQVNTIENILFWAFGCFSVVLGFVFLIFVNQENIMQFINGSEQLSVLYSTFVYFKDFTVNFVANVYQIFTFVLSSVGEYFEKVRYILIFSLSILGVVQYVLYKRGKLRV